jgi:hypothetical protein
MKSENRTAFGRRQFLWVIGTGAALAVSPLIAEAQADSESTDEKQKSRYTESDHVKAFYTVNRYPR